MPVRAVDLLYIANMRMPTEKAHGLQIMQNCESFAAAGATVTLWASRRFNTAEMRRITDPYAHYGVARSFAIRRIPCLDLFPVGKWFEAVAFPLQSLTFTLVAALMVLFRRTTSPIYYSREALVLLALSWFCPRRTLVYEAHQLYKSGRGQWLQSMVCRRVGLVVAVTGRLGADLKALGAHEVMTAHDGFSVERFANLPDRQTVRTSLGLSAEAFIVGYVGQLHTMSMSKGIDILIDGIAQARDVPITLCLVGGPPEMVEQLRARWQGLGLPAERFVAPGRVNPAQVPPWIAAFDVATLLFPWTPHFAYYASPLKLFEYMAAGTPILASDLPAIAEVVRHQREAWLVAPNDAAAIAGALRELYRDPALRDRVSAAARQLAPDYSWSARAQHILASWQAVQA